MIKRLFTSVAITALLLSPAFAEEYSYPINDPYEATVVGTPVADRPELPKKIRSKRLDLTIFEDRAIPDALFYNYSLFCSFAWQKEKAPLIFVIAGTGANYRSAKMQMMEKAFYQAGFHVISISSPTTPNFIVTASESSLPGHLEDDARDLYRVMQVAWQQVKDKIEVSEFYLTGYSLGATQAAFVAKLDDTEHAFDFKKVLMINPAVSLYNSVAILDKMLENNVPGGLDNIDSWFNDVISKLSRATQGSNRIMFNDPDFLYKVYQHYPPSKETSASLIGFVFRISSSNMIITADIMNGGGYIIPKNRIPTRNDSFTEYAEVTFRIAFLDYFKELFLPYFKAQQPNLTEQALIEMESLQHIEPYLQQAGKIGVVTNADDLILAPGELDYMRSLFGARAKIYPNGGHCGNMDDRSHVQYVTNYFKQ
jgi:hypothetical protein